jgi:hypothetical protein
MVVRVYPHDEGLAPQELHEEIRMRALSHDVADDADDAQSASDSGRSQTSSRQHWKTKVASLPNVFFLQHQEKRSLVIDPDSLGSTLWSVIVLVALLCNTFFVPFQVAFHPPNRTIDTLFGPMGYLFDGVLWVDAVVISLFRGFHTQGRKEMDAARIRARYVCTLASISHQTLGMNILGLMPLQELLDLASSPSRLRGAMRLNRLILAPRILILVRELGEARCGRHRVLVVRLVGLYAFLVHTIGCLWCGAYQPHRSPRQEGDHRSVPLPACLNSLFSMQHIS